MSESSRSDPFIKRHKSATGLRDLTLMVIVVLALGSGVTWFVTHFEMLSWDFRNNLWAPAQLLMTGHGAYDLAPFDFEMGRAVWFPPVITVFFIFGLLSQQLATNVWLILSTAILLVVVIGARDGRRPRPWLFGLLLAAAYLFPPTITHLALGQVTLLAMGLFLLVTHHFERLPRWASAALLAVALCKPQLGVLVLPGLLLQLWRREGAGSALVYLAQLLAAGAALTAPLFLAEPAWPADFVRSLGGNPQWLQPSLLTIARLHLGPLGFVLWAPVAIGVFALNLRLWERRSAREAVLWSLALTPLATPYVWSWDFVLLLPLFAHTAFHAQTRRALFFLFAGYAVCWTAAISLALSVEEVGNHLYWWIPWLLLGIVAGASSLERRGTQPVGAQ